MVHFCGHTKSFQDRPFHQKVLWASLQGVKQNILYSFKLVLQNI